MTLDRRHLLVAVLAFTASDAKAACPDLDTALHAAEATVTEAQFDATAKALEDAEAALGCGPPATPLQIARLWITEGTMLQLEGDVEAAADSFAAARRIAPDYWTKDFGPKLEEAFRAAPAAEGASSTLAVTPPIVTYKGFLDGAPAQFPAAASPGLHLVQVGPTTTEMAVARIVYVPPGQTVTLPTGLVEVAPVVIPPVVVTPPVVVAPPAVVTPPVVTPPKPTRPPIKVSVPLVVGGAALVSSAVSFGVSASQTARYAEAESFSELDAVKNTQIATGAAGIGLAALGAAGLLVHVAF